MTEYITNIPPGMERQDDILVLSWPLAGNDSTINDGSREDKVLTEYLKDFLKKKTEKEDIEVFCINGNIAATSEGFIGTFRRYQVEKIKTYTV